MTAAPSRHLSSSTAKLARFIFCLSVILFVTMLPSAAIVGRAAPLEAVALDPDVPTVGDFSADGLGAPPGWSVPVAYTVPGMQTPNDLAVNYYTNRLYITSRDNNSLLMLDTTNMQVLKKVTVGPLPWGVAVAISTNKVYVANFGNGTMSVLDGATLAPLTTIDFGSGSQPALLGFLSDRLVIALHGLNKFALVNPTNDTLVGTVSIGDKGMWGLATDGSRHRIFLSFRDSGVVKVFDEWLFWWWWVTPTGGTVKPCGAAGSPYGLAYNGSAKKLFVSCASVGGGSVDTAVVYSVSDGGALTEIARNSLDPGGSNGGMVALGNWGNVLFTNSASGTLSVIGDYSNRVVATLTMGSDPFGMAVDYLYGMVYVGDRGGNRLLVFRDDYVPSLRGGNGIAVDPTAGQLYVTSKDNGLVLMLNGTTHWTDAVLTVGGRPWGIAMNPATRRVYAASYDTGKLNVIGANGMDLIKQVQVGWEPTFVDVDTSLNLVFVVSHKLNELWVISGQTNQAIARPSTGGGKGAWGLAVNPKLRRAYVAHRDSGELVTMVGVNGWNVNGDYTIQACEGSRLPYGMAFNPVNDRLYVTCASGRDLGADVDTVVIFEAKADGLTRLATLPIGHGGPNGGGGIAVDTATGNVLITNSASNSVTIVSGRDRVIKTMYVGLDPFGATADPVARRFHVTLRLGNNVINIADTFSDPYRLYLPMMSR